MSYTPKIKELVMTLVPNEPKDVKPEIAMVVGLASKDDKLQYIERINKELGTNEELDKDSVKNFLENSSVYICLYEDDIKLVDYENILGPLTKDDETQATLTL